MHNSGSTIPEREQARVVERFYRGTQARHIPGTGMGLAIVQQIARALGLSRHTVHEYVKRIYRCVGVASRGELLARN